MKWRAWKLYRAFFVLFLACEMVIVLNLIASKKGKITIFKRRHRSRHVSFKVCVVNLNIVKRLLVCIQT